MELTDHKLLEQLLVHVINIQDTVNRVVTKDEFNKFTSEVYSHINGFVKLHETLDTELVALRS